MTAAKVSPRTRQVVLERDLFRCVACGTYVGPFGDYSLHHRRPRGMGGSRRPETNLPGNLLVLCGSGTTGCHGWTETHRDEALSMGLLVSQFVTDPDQVPVQTYCGWFVFDNEGGKTPVEVPA